MIPRNPDSVPRANADAESAAGRAGRDHQGHDQRHFDRSDRQRKHEGAVRLADAQRDDLRVMDGRDDCGDQHQCACGREQRAVRQRKRCGQQPEGEDRYDLVPDVHVRSERGRKGQSRVRAHRAEALTGSILAVRYSAGSGLLPAGRRFR